jgi:ABC-type sugar transport system, periplasmic component
VKKKYFIILFVFLIALTGCRKSDNQPIVNNKMITLTVLAGQSTSDAGIEDMIDDALKEKYPNVKLDWECVDWGEKFNLQMQGKFAAGDIPDIMIGKAQDVKTYALTENIAPISDECSSRIKKDILKSVTVDGVVYGLPYNTLYQGVIYNKNIFNKYGLSVPQTQKEMEHIITVLNQHHITPFACHYLEPWQIGNMTMQFYMNDLFRYHPTWGDAFREGNVSYQSSPIMQDCLKYNKSIMSNTWKDAVDIDQFESDSRFTSGKAAMYLTGSWSLQFTEQYSNNIDYGIFPYPNKNGDSMLIRETNMTFMKSSKTKYSKLISDIFLTLISDKKLAREIFGFTQTNSAIKGIESYQRNKIQDDIDWYEKNNKVIDVSLGNSQLVWEFQNELAKEQMKWLNHEIKFDELLKFADKYRENSKY